MAQLLSATPGQSEAEPSSISINKDRYDLFVMNTEVGITGVVSISSRSRDEAVEQYERANPACAVISVLMPDQ